MNRWLSLSVWLAACAANAQPMTQAADPACTLPELLMAWNKPPASIATVTERRASDLAGSVNQPYRASLAPCAAAWCAPGSHAAMVKINVPQAGRWRVALDTMLWIDVWNANARQEGVLCEHHGCQPLRKIVQYDLQPGTHWVVLQGKAPGDSGLLLTRVGD
jgi:hypothetical protein